jgi:hypothetical protein
MRLMYTGWLVARQRGGALRGFDVDAWLTGLFGAPLVKGPGLALGIVNFCLVEFSGKSA